MKKFCTLILMSILVIPSMAQINYLNRFVTDEFLQGVFTGGYNLHSGRYNKENNIYQECVFSGKITNWDVKIETNDNGRIDSIVYSFNKYRSHSIIPSSSEIKNIADNVINVSGARVIKRELVDKPSLRCKVDYEAEIPSSSILCLKTIYVNGGWDYNGFGQVFFDYLNIYYIMTGHE